MCCRQDSNDQPLDRPQRWQLVTSGKATFYARLSDGLRGRYSFGGGVELIAGRGMLRPAELHEQMHAELVDNSTYGFMQKILFDCIHNDGLSVDAREHCADMFDRSIHASWQVQEGLATFRAAAWVYWNMGHHEAVAFRESLPDRYKAALSLADELLSVIAADARNERLSVALHITCVAVGLAALNVTVLPAFRDLDSVLATPVDYIDDISPDHRFGELAGSRQAVVEALGNVYEGAVVDYEKLMSMGQMPSEELILRQYEGALLYMREAVPSVQMLLMSERNRQIDQIGMGWLGVLKDPASVVLAHGGIESVLRSKVHKPRRA